MNLSICDLRLIVEALQKLYDNTPEDLEYQRSKRDYAEKLMSICRNKILDIEAIRVE